MSSSFPLGAGEFAQRVIAWQRAQGRHDLPWQNTRDPYRIWLSEVMLQQTQVTVVMAYYGAFLQAFPDVHALASASRERVLECWSGLGYYRRAHHLHTAAQEVVSRYGGEFPPDAASLAALPGIGRSTAAAIAVLAFGAREAILDGNVKRVLARHRSIAGYPGAPKVAARLWQAAHAMLPARDLEVYTQGLMDLGATVCVRKQPKCGICPVRADCAALREGRVNELPAPRPRKPLPQRAVRVLLIERGGEILLEKRPANGIWGGLWSFPELPLDADIGVSLRTRFAVEATLCQELPTIAHGFTHYALTLHPCRVGVSEWPGRAEAPGFVWLSPADAHGAALPAPIKKLLRSLRENREGMSAGRAMLGAARATVAGDA